jgi:hypothetical protein
MNCVIGVIGGSCIGDWKVKGIDLCWF